MARGATGVNQVRAASEVNQLPVFPCTGGVLGEAVRCCRTAGGSGDGQFVRAGHLATSAPGLTSTWPPRAPGRHEQRVTRSEPRTAERALCVSPPRPPPLRRSAVYAARQMTRLEGSGVRNCGPQAHSVLAIAPRGAISPRSGCIRCLSSRFRANNGAKAQPFTDLVPSSVTNL